MCVGWVGRNERVLGGWLGSNECVLGGWGWVVGQ